MQMESGTVVEMMSDIIDSLSSKSSCLEEKCVVGAKCSFCQASWFPDGVYSRVQEFLPLKNVNLRLFDSQSSSSSSEQTEDDEMVLKIQTPPKCIFDPFAPGPDDLMLAPRRKKQRNSYVHLRRRLEFEIDDAENVQGFAVEDSEEDIEVDAVKDSDEEEQFFNSVFNSILEMIISIHLQEIPAETLVTDSDISEDCCTPDSLPLLQSIAHACPPAPTRKFLGLERNVDHRICRKLEFGAA